MLKLTQSPRAVCKEVESKRPMTDDQPRPASSRHDGVITRSDYFDWQRRNRPRLGSEANLQKRPSEATLRSVQQQEHKISCAIDTILSPTRSPLVSVALARRKATGQRTGLSDAPLPDGRGKVKVVSGCLVHASTELGLAMPTVDVKMFRPE
ncbi:unnamed protein product [Protopolystoma xenopodis]|uniref:Uncharacterized protein n=1 Tax=Protopolystoma xenopodis TaxID=117903 RepID=A0A3S5CNW6_9PLAT|nr:unnamed protein product [Protopolystoma xenopodis]